MSLTHKVIFYLHSHHVNITFNKINNNSILSSNINFPNDLKYIVLQLICWSQDPNKVYIIHLVLMSLKMCSTTFPLLFLPLLVICFRYRVEIHICGLGWWLPQDSLSWSPPLISYDLIDRSGDQITLRTSPFHLMVLAFIDDCWLGLFLH